MFMGNIVPLKPKLGIAPSSTNQNKIFLALGLIMEKCFPCIYLNWENGNESWKHFLLCTDEAPHTWHTWQGESSVSLSTSLWARTGAFILMVSSPRPTLAEHVDWRKGRRDQWVENKQRQRGDLRSSTNSVISWLGESGRCCQWHKEEDWLHLGIHLFTHSLNKPFVGWPPTCMALCLWFGVWQWTRPSPRDGVARVPFTPFI